MRKDDGFAVQLGVDLVARDELLACGARLVERNVAGFARLGDGGRHAFALGFIGADEFDVVGRELLELGQLRLVVCEPCVLVLQSSSFRLEVIHVGNYRSAGKPCARGNATGKKATDWSGGRGTVTDLGA